MGTEEDGDFQSGDSATLKDDINELMDLIQSGCEHAVIRHLDAKRITPDQCLELFKNEECQSSGKYRGPVLEAAECGHLNIMNALISRGFSCREFNLTDDFKTQPIHVGCSLGHLDIVKSLVDDHGVSVDETDSELNTPLYYCFLNCNPQTYDIVKYLLESGASVNWQVSDHITPLQECVATSESTPELCQLLITFGADVNVDSRCTPLYRAAKKNRVDFVKVLLDAGAHIDIVDRYQTTPLLTAAKYNNLEVLIYLCSRGADPEHTDKFGNTALHFAAQKGHYDIAKYLIGELGIPVNVKNSCDETPLLKAVSEMQTDIVNLLLKSGYRPPRKEVDYYTKHFVSRREGVKTLLETLKRSLYTVPSLQELCIFQVRAELGRTLAGAVDRLPVPRKLKNMIRLSYL